MSSANRIIIGRQLQASPQRSLVLVFQEQNTVRCILTVPRQSPVDLEGGDLLSVVH
ncbi:hypothetical protein FIBSPDRAFT_876500 [Athelia psychrophila]|uniref:Uncharacterized protein n=1 Tax=Athelia psychrophila TaxID=1759441 RepID=A0A167WUL9_9AGAM|nr:hypothetical protein FIBSPDRAFT_876500 [Fibularhizoctonia sp. CBS 109695]